MSAPIQESTRLKVVSRAPTPSADPDDADITEHMMLQMGPAHPTMHGVVQMTVELDGETVECPPPAQYGA